MITESSFEVEVKGGHPNSGQSIEVNFFRLISINSHVLSKLVITYEMYKTSGRDRGRQVDKIDSI